MTKLEYHSGRIGHRHGLMVLLFFGSMFLYAARVGLSVAMVAMTKPIPKPSFSSNNTSFDVCPHINDEDQSSAANHTGSRSPEADGSFDWDTQTQGILHGAFFYGYLISQIPGGFLADKLGAKRPIAISATLVGVLSIVSPFLTKLGGVWLFFAGRLLIGVAQGAFYPSVTSLWRFWAPPVERGRLLAVTYSGSQVGTAFGMFLAGMLADALGWESVFYTFGALCLVWVLPWLFLAFDTPDAHPRITHAEKRYISNAIQARKNNTLLEAKELQNERRRTPWKAILTSVPVWALLATEFGHNWGFYTLQTNLPTYLSNILHFSLKSNGLLSAMPYLVRWGMTLASIGLADWLLARGIVRATILRKVLSILAFLCTAAAITGVGFVGCDYVSAVVLFALGVGSSGFIYAGYLINYTELSVHYAGTLVGLGNTVGTITGIAAPYVIGVLTSGENGQTITNWRIVFGISAGLYTLISIIYGVFGSAKRQRWDME